MKRILAWLRRRIGKPAPTYVPREVLYRLKSTSYRTRDGRVLTVSVPSDFSENWTDAEKTLRNNYLVMEGITIVTNQPTPESHTAKTDNDQPVQRSEMEVN